MKYRKWVDMKKIWEVLEQKIQNKYHISDQEWVQVDVSNRGKIHTTIVTNSEVPKSEIRSIIEEELEKYGEKYTIGFIDIYSVEKAEEFNLEKIRKKNGYAKWTDALYAAEDEKSNDSSLQIISFYSYKGGVGRTIAMIETAYNLAMKGKRVLLLDLDIEAPSLHNIFADKVNDEHKGVKYGIIEYLYRKVVQKKNDISVNEIFCSLELQKVPGEMFLIPALKKMDKEYIYQIERLQTQQLQEQEIFNQIFEYIRNELDVDTVLIDTRAGFNEWGSLSLLTLSDQVIFIAYPNAENIEGLNVAFEMLQNVGKKRYAVAMSKVVPSDEGGEKAKALFAELNISQEELIPIYYREEIALSSRYPITADVVLRAYRELSEYILNNERIRQNREFLANGKKDQMLRDIFCEEKHLVALEDVGRFMGQRAYALLKYDYKEELHGLQNNVSYFYIMNNHVLIPTSVYTVIGTENEEVEALLTKDTEDEEQLGLELLDETVCNSSLKDEIVIPKEHMKLEEVLCRLKRKVPKSEVLILNNEEDAESSKEEYEVTPQIRIILPITAGMLEKDAVRVVDNIRRLVTRFNKEDVGIQFKFTIHSDIWKIYQELFGVLKGVISEVKVGWQDICRFIMSNLEQGQLESYQQYINTQAILNVDERVYRIGRRNISETEMKENIELVLGVRKDVRTYSTSVIAYLYQILEQNPGMRYDMLLDCMKKAAEKENMDDASSDRLISFDNLRYEVERLAGQI